MKKEAEQLHLLFYPAFYLSGFGSIFPKVDLCNFIPEEFGIDVAILEEPVCFCYLLLLRPVYRTYVILFVAHTLAFRKSFLIDYIGTFELV